jgi:hypothetical protein
LINNQTRAGVGPPVIMTAMPMIIMIIIIIIIIDDDIGDIDGPSRS